jgi:hypothetical protein
MKKIRAIHDLINKSEFTEKIKIFFSTKTKGDDYDTYEKTYEITNLNPITIRGIVRMISPEALVWKQYGLNEIGAIEIITEYKYKKWFELCTKVEYKDDTYNVLKEATGSRAVIQARPNNTLRVILQKA